MKWERRLVIVMVFLALIVIAALLALPLLAHAQGQSGGCVWVRPAVPDYCQDPWLEVDVIHPECHPRPILQCPPTDWSMPPDYNPKCKYNYTVQPWDTIDSISQMMGIPIQELRDANGGWDPQPGHFYCIPR